MLSHSDATSRISIINYPRIKVRMKKQLLCAKRWELQCKEIAIDFATFLWHFRFNLFFSMAAFNTCISKNWESGGSVQQISRLGAVESQGWIRNIRPKLMLPIRITRLVPLGRNEDSFTFKHISSIWESNILYSDSYLHRTVNTSIPVMAAIAVRKKVVNIGYFLRRFCS